MPPFEYDDLVDDAVLLLPQMTPGGIPVTNRMGEIVYTSPTATLVRWTDCYTESKDPKGNTITIEAEIVAAMDIPIGSIIWKGLLANYVGTGGDAVKFMRVERKCFAQDLKGRFQRYEFDLCRFRGTLPTLSM